TPVDAKDSSYFKIYFTSHPPKRPVKEFQLGTLGIAPVVPALIVPADEVKTFRIQATIPEDISLISIVPHMHLIGKSYLAYAVKPNGDTIPLIRIPRWDFRWQYFYQFKNLLKLPRGTTIYVEGVYDNTAENPNNPFQPPREIREREGSMKTTDEMFQLIITYVPYQQGDENISQEIQQPK
ncbi:MAG: cytochrome c, partial [Bacteroidota bacterium]